MGPVNAINKIVNTFTTAVIEALQRKWIRAQHCTISWKSRRRRPRAKLRRAQASKPGQGPQPMLSLPHHLRSLMIRGHIPQPPTRKNTPVTVKVWGVDPRPQSSTPTRLRRDSPHFSRPPRRHPRHHHRTDPTTDPRPTLPPILNPTSIPVHPIILTSVLLPPRRSPRAQ